MRLSQSLSMLLLGGVCIFSAQAQTNFDLIPKPAKVTVATGTYAIPAHLSVIVSDGFQETTQLLTEHPAIKSVNVEVLKKNKKTPKEGFRIVKAIDTDNLSKNAYTIQIDEKGVLIKAWDVPQIINAIYTLIQLGYLQAEASKIAFATIMDEPRFTYRGLHLDVSRHFMPLSFVKKYIDIMAIYKFNTFHWHLTDGAGWRLEIKKYPELTQKAAWRTHRNWKDWMNNGRQYIEKGSPNASGGFYTQDEARELVAYAARKGINVIPEIEMPGHSEEVLAVYPELACTGKPYTQGEFCIGNEKTFEFLKNVLDEVLTIFPSQYIHVGGDEAEKKHWESCPKDQALMKREGLKSVDELQSYAIRQMDLYLQSKGRKLIGWDEILQGGLTEGATVMSWRGEEGGIKAANAGHDVIMTPESHLYFDYYQTDPRTQPEAIGGYLPLDKVYSYDPVPAAIDADKAKHILGAQGNMWTEYVPTTEHVEYMAFPRALALSETNWTSKEAKSWTDFHKRLQSHYKLLQELSINYYRPSFNVVYRAEYHADKNNNKITLATEQLNSNQIRYTIDGSAPKIHSTPYTGPFELSATGHINAAYFLDSIQIGPTLSFDIDIHRAIGRKVTYNSPWSGYPAQKDSTLTNGVMGGLSYHDGQWQGFTSPIDVVVDMERREEIHQVAMRFMQLTGPGIYMPGEMEVLVSDNGRTFRKIGSVSNDISDQESKLTIKRFDLKLDKPQQARYIKIKASNPNKGFLFTDEIIVY